jgi:hypothetical protein
VNPVPLIIGPVCTTTGVVCERRILPAAKPDGAVPAQAGVQQNGGSIKAQDNRAGALSAGEAPALGSAFAFVRIMPTAWIVRAERLRVYQLGTTYAVFELCFEQPRATVFVLEKAIEIRDNCSRLFPDAKLEPATFEQWIEQEAG